MRYLCLKHLPNQKNQPFIGAEEMMLFASFQILEDFVKHELGGEFPRCDLEFEELDSDYWEMSWNSYKAWNVAYAEMEALLNWWTERRKELYAGSEDKDQVMLKRLVEVLGFMWT